MPHITLLVALNLTVSGRGDTVYCDDNSIKNKSRATASLLVQAHTLIHYIDWTDLSSILRDFPSFREDFLTNMMFSFQIGTLRKVSVSSAISLKFQISQRLQTTKTQPMKYLSVNSLGFNNVLL